SEMESLEHQCRRLATSTSAESAPTESLLGQMQDVQLDFQRLSQDLRDERNERCRSLADVNRLVESVAMSTSATIQDAEQRLSTQISKGGFFGGGSTSPGLHRQDLDVSVSGDVRSSLGSGFAKMVGEMDAELRVEMNARLRLMTADVRSDILKDVSVRIATAEARCGAIEADLNAKFHS
ncbi:unnamed protein product, partial [Polarella glacialis]